MLPTHRTSRANGSQICSQTSYSLSLVYAILPGLQYPPMLTEYRRLSPLSWAILPRISTRRSLSALLARLSPSLSSSRHGPSTTASRCRGCQHRAARARSRSRWMARKYHEAHCVLTRRFMAHAGAYKNGSLSSRVGSSWLQQEILSKSIFTHDIIFPFDCACCRQLPYWDTLEH